MSQFIRRAIRDKNIVIHLIYFDTFAHRKTLTETDD